MNSTELSYNIIESIKDELTESQINLLDKKLKMLVKKSSQETLNKVIKATEELKRNQ